MDVQERLKKLKAEINKKAPPLPTVRLKPVRGETTVFDSKMGGVPYFPKDMEYPAVREGNSAGKPLKFLAQLNFEKLPHIPGFPEKGILQFFAGYDGDDVFGLNFDDPTDQNGFRVIYHENISEDADLINELPEIETDDFPFTGEFLLKAEKAEQANVTYTDYRFDSALIESYNSLFDANINCVYAFNENAVGLNQIDNELCEALFDNDEDREDREDCGTRMGGYAYFTQDDPRRDTDKYGDFQVMLFQSDSENGNPNGDERAYEDEIMWGDVGVANFFISAADLAKRDFSRVLYNWDCC